MKTRAEYLREIRARLEAAQLPVLDDMWTRMLLTDTRVLQEICEAQPPFEDQIRKNLGWETA